MRSTRRDNADTDFAVSQHDTAGITASTPEQIRALADEADVEAAEAEALAAAARARARALQLRRKADLVETTQEHKVPQRLAAPEQTAKAGAPSTLRASRTRPASEETAPLKEPNDLNGAPSDDTEAQGDCPIAEEQDCAEETAGDAGEQGEAGRGSGDGIEDTAETVRKRRGGFRRPTVSTIATVIAILIVVTAGVLSGLMIKAHHAAVRQQQQVAEFTAAARQGVVAMTSLDFNNAKQGVQRILENSTGSFKDEFLKMADDFTKVVEQSKVVSEGSVQSAAVDLNSMSDNSAVVLVACTSEVTNSAGAKQDPRKYRLIVTLARDGGQLKLSKVEFVP